MQSLELYLTMVADALATETSDLWFIKLWIENVYYLKWILGRYWSFKISILITVSNRAKHGIMCGSYSAVGYHPELHICSC